VIDQRELLQARHERFTRTCETHGIKCVFGGGWGHTAGLLGVHLLALLSARAAHSKIAHQSHPVVLHSTVVLHKDRELTAGQPNGRPMSKSATKGRRRDGAYRTQELGEGGGVGWPNG
jgi:hypothetical protein